MRPATGGIPRAVWAITALHVGLLLAYSVLFASFRGPDEPQHVDLVRYVRETASYPSFDERNLGGGVFRALDEVRFDVPAVRSRDLPGDQAPLRAGRPPFDELGSDLQTVADERNQLPSHPPLYYGLAAAVMEGSERLIPGELAFDQEVGLLRLLGALMLAPLPLLVYVTARRLGARPAVGITGALLPLAIPQLHHIGASVTNDNLLTLLIGTVTWLCVRIATGDTRVKTAAAAGLLSGLALLTKAFALFLPLMVVGAFGLAVARGSRRNTALTGLGVAALLTFVAGGWWWFRNLLVFGQVQTGIKLLDAAPADFQPDVGWWVSRYLRFLPWRFWGWFGWFDVSLPAVLVTVATVVVLAGVVRAFVRPGSGPSRSDLLLLLLPTGAIAAMVAVGAFQGYLRTGFDEGLQGRYLFPGLVGLAVVFGVGWGRFRWGPPAVLAAALVMQATAAVTILGFYWGGDSLVAEARSMVAWSPWPAAVLAVGGVALGAALPWVIAEVARQSRPAPQRP
jgi:small subunit ribosomal protein S36